MIAPVAVAVVPVAAAALGVHPEAEGKQLNKKDRKKLKRQLMHQPQQPQQQQGVTIAPLVAAGGSVKHC